MTESDTDLPVSVEGPPPKASVTVARASNGKPLRVAGKLKTTIDAMVWEGKTWQEGAKVAGMDLRACRRALEKPHVQRYIREQRAAFRSALSTRNETVLADVRDKSLNGMARVAAVRALDQLSDNEHVLPSRQVTPGVVVMVNVNAGERKVDETIIQVGNGDNEAVR